MNNICNHCYALKWKEETKGFCCVNGQIVLAPLSPAPPILYTLLTGNDPDSDEPYVKQIRLYNQILAFTSVSANVDNNLANAKEGVYTYKIHGALYHQIGGLMPNDENEPKFAQIYFHDSSLQYQLERRKELFPNLNEDMFNALLNELHAINPFITVFMTAGTRARNENLSDMILTIHNVHGKDMRRYNLPTASEISAIITDFTTEPRDIVIKTHEDKLHHISELHAAYDPLQYPLLFPYGEYGWHDNILRANEIASNPESRMSQSESVIPMEIDFAIPMDIEERKHTDIGSHTEASQAMSDLLIGSPSSIIMSKDKGKGKEKEIESDNDNNNNSESESKLEAVFDDKDLKI